MMVQPHDKQHPSAQKQGLNVQRMHEATLEVMTPWFNDKEHPDNAQKAVFFKEIFKVAKAEERYLNGEIGKASDDIIWDIHADKCRCYNPNSSHVR